VRPPEDEAIARRPDRNGRPALAASAAAAIALLFAITGCSPAPTVIAPPSSPSTSADASSAPTGSAVSTRPQPVDLAHLSITLVPRWRGFTSPLWLTNAGDGSGRLFVAEQAGRVLVIREGRVASRPYLDISALISTGGERGLLGVAFAPHFAANGHVYLDYTDSNGDTVVARYTASDSRSDSPTWTRRETLLHIAQPYSNHNGGCVQFGPDGYLWIGMGDGGSAGDPGNRAQDPRVLLGKMLRIDVEGQGAGARYAIPPGQPAKAGWAPEVWMIGLRNPWRFSWDASTSATWIGDVGQDAWEEIDVAGAGVGGQNWGWPQWEANHAYRRGAARADFAFPVHEYPHPSGESITGGYVYRGSKYPALVGTYLYADFVKGWLGALRTTDPDGRALAKPQTRTLLTNIGQPSSFGVDESGELYLVDLASGTISSIEATAR
jgi:glucose/arabinose dehydrogenase